MTKTLEFEKDLVDRISTIWRRFGLSLDIPVIDTQHLWLIAIIVRLENILEDGSFKEIDHEFQAALADVVDYGAEHFALEEFLLEAAGYEDLSAHVRGHTRFVANLRLRARQVTRGEPKESARKLLQSLKHWLFQHILSEDGKYANYFKEHGIDGVELARRTVDSGDFSIRQEHDSLYQLITTREPEHETLDQDIVDSVSRIWHRYHLKTGIVIVDIQHLWLIRMIVELDHVNRRRMVESKVSVEDRRVFSGILLQTVDYINEHFAAEENIMRTFNFPGLANHVRNHRSFAEATAKRARENPVEDPQVVARLVADLKEWLISHIAVEDKKIYYYLRKRLDEVNEYVLDATKAGEMKLHREHAALYKHIVKFENDLVGSAAN